MKKYLGIIAILLFSIQLFSQVSLISIDSLLLKINKKTDSSEIKVFNFWATWCKPCVQELPLFIKADSILKAKNVEFIFVSFDGPSEIKKVKKFIRSKKLIGTQYILNSYDLNTFIPSVDRRWQGNIPYTIVSKNGRRKNHEFNFETWEELLFFINN